jgi:hypothetical protein
MICQLAMPTCSSMPGKTLSYGHNYTQVMVVTKGVSAHARPQRDAAAKVGPATNAGAVGQIYS